MDNYCFDRGSFVKSGLTRLRKQAEEIPAAPNTMHMTMIWYLAAISGEMPDNIWPVIMPGIETRPTANRELVIGIREDLKAMLRAWS